MVIFLCNLVETKFYLEEYTIYFGVVSIFDLSRHYNKIDIYMEIFFKNSEFISKYFSDM